MSADIVSAFMQKNIFLNPSAMDYILKSRKAEDIMQAASLIERKNTPVFFDNSMIDALFVSSAELKPSVFVIKSYNEEPKKREVGHFVSYMRARYDQLRDILMNRLDMQSAISIKRATEKKTMEKTSLVGMVLKKEETKNGNICLTLEDQSGHMKAIVRKDNRKSFESANELTMDEVIGVTGSCNGEVFFVNDLLLPDIPVAEFKKGPDDVSAAFISDLHIGSKMFLKDEFLKFISWINGETGTDEQKKEAMKIKYLFIAGDLVDGIGIYPEQDNELEIKDIIEQYNECARYLSIIRKDISIIICGGNHDAIRISEPQPVLEKTYAAALYTLSNAIFVSNPAMINIHAVKGFPGFNVMMYHGYSFDYYISNVESIRHNGGYDRGDLVMKHLLQKRHLCPTHGSSLYIPDEKTDPLVIDKVPDIFITGHIHKTAISNYKSTTLLSGSCWQSKTAFQEKVGHNPEPARVPVVNLKTREVKVVKFMA
ncbi:MAG: DNA-directed DNA polymerase II small subunit [Candidatus Nanoarchaeia archaeon]|nr:DNA-directed DNA polymerase II small subunit [Candidatus Nanoarchaeia archaeon]